MSSLELLSVRTMSRQSLLYNPPKPSHHLKSIYSKDGSREGLRQIHAVGTEMISLYKRVSSIQTMSEHSSYVNIWL